MWDVIKCHLENILSGKDLSFTSYYIGGGLCVDNIIGNDILVLSLDGEVSLFKCGWRSIQPQYINILVQKIYLRFKGDTNHLVENTFKTMEMYNDADYFLPIHR